MIGAKFGRLTVIAESSERRHGYVSWLCRCECGVEKVCAWSHLKNGLVMSCGCMRREMLRAGREKLHKTSVTHGGSKKREYHIWANVIYRCDNPNATSYERYGGRGITVCQRWRDGFEFFYEDMGPSPSLRHTIDRINNDGNYEPGNCRWATRRAQANNRRGCVEITHQGETMTIAMWAERFGMTRNLLWDRLNRQNWPIEKALNTPIDTSKHSTRKRDK
jgi:hypothetical protein